MYSLNDYNVIWKTPGKDSADSMPTGNGDIGINVWTDAAGDFLMYLGKTDSWDENGRLLKVGRIRIHFDPSPFRNPVHFKQELYLKESVIQLEADDFSASIWVDANRPVVHIDGKSSQKYAVSVKLELWRTERKPLTVLARNDPQAEQIPEGSRSEAGIVEAGLNPIILPDTVAEDPEHIIWYHRNETSMWARELEHQGLGGFTGIGKDPLLYRTSGGMISAEGFQKNNDGTLSCAETDTLHISVVLLMAQTETAGQWVEEISSLLRKISAVPREQAYQEHCHYWESFWNRSYIKLTAPGEEKEEADTITRMWHLHRYTVACAGRGNLPMKFNGSIFNVDGEHNVPNSHCGRGYNADFRGWGGCYWFQNQRQIYWPMLACGDFECMLPFFKMYYHALPFSQYMTQQWYHHEGAVFPETLYFWGAHSRTYYGPKPACERAEPGVIDGPYIKRYWQGGLELSSMMLSYYRYTRDEKVFHELLYPVIHAVMTFYDQHYPLDQNGKMRIEPAQCLETIWEAKNPLPEIAGLQNVLEGLLDLPDGLIPDADKQWAKNFLAKVPGLKTGNKNGKTILLPCEECKSDTHNQENISMYAVFPYRRFGLFRDNLDLAINTFQERDYDAHYSCWHNNNVFAAYLGLEHDARKNLAKRFEMHDGYRFPTFYVNGDWVPDLDNGGVSQQTVQAMLVQCSQDELILFPAFPSNWDAEFRLCTEKGTTIEVERVDGRVHYREI